MAKKVKIKCSWCGKEGEYKPSYVTKDGGVERTQIRCHYCARFIPSSIKHLTGNVVGSSHYHEEYT